MSQAVLLCLLIDLSLFGEARPNPAAAQMLGGVRRVQRMLEAAPDAFPGTRLRAFGLQGAVGGVALAEIAHATGDPLETGDAPLCSAEEDRVVLTTQDSGVDIPNAEIWAVEEIDLSTVERCLKERLRLPIPRIARPENIAGDLFRLDGEDAEAQLIRSVYADALAGWAIGLEGVFVFLIAPKEIDRVSRLAGATPLSTKTPRARLSVPTSQGVMPWDELVAQTDERAD